MKRCLLLFTLIHLISFLKIEAWIMEPYFTEIRISERIRERIDQHLSGYDKFLNYQEIPAHELANLPDDKLLEIDVSAFLHYFHIPEKHYNYIAETINFFLTSLKLLNERIIADNHIDQTLLANIKQEARYVNYVINKRLTRLQYELLVSTGWIQD